MTRSDDTLRSDTIVERVMRSSAWSAFGYIAQQAVRLGANLVLTRLLFPEAFGLMALVTVFMVGLMMFSDVGISPSIQHSRRGDERDFLDTAWTIQVIRGTVLWLATCAMAVPAAAFYGEPALAQLLPVAGLALLVAGFDPTRAETANRHLMLGRVTLLKLGGQIAGILLTILLAWALQSVWALAVGGVLGRAAELAALHFGMPGRGNRFRWERDAARELVGFGKWIFLSTICGFIVNQGDKAVLGRYLTMSTLGIYNIGFFLASVPVLLGNAVTGKVLIPLYRERPPAASAGNFRKIRVMRFWVTGGLMAVMAALAHGGVALVTLLYDPRYAAAGGILVVITCVQLPQLIGLTYDRAALAAGDSRRFFYLSAARAVLQLGLFLAGAEAAGLLGALAGQGLAWVLILPLTALLARRHGAWDPLHDGIFCAAGLAVAASALWHNREAVAALAALGTG